MSQSINDLLSSTRSTRNDLKSSQSTSRSKNLEEYQATKNNYSSSLRKTLTKDFSNEKQKQADNSFKKSSNSLSNTNTLIIKKADNNTQDSTQNDYNQRNEMLKSQNRIDHRQKSFKTISNISTIKTDSKNSQQDAMKFVNENKQHSQSLKFITPNKTYANNSPKYNNVHHSQTMKNHIPHTEENTLDQSQSSNGSRLTKSQRSNFDEYDKTNTSFSVAEKHSYYIFASDIQTILNNVINRKLKECHKIWHSKYYDQNVKQMKVTVSLFMVLKNMIQSRRLFAFKRICNHNSNQQRQANLAYNIEQIINKKSKKNNDYIKSVQVKNWRLRTEKIKEQKIQVALKICIILNNLILNKKKQFQQELKNEIIRRNDLLESNKQYKKEIAINLFLKLSKIMYKQKSHFFNLFEQLVNQMFEEKQYLLMQQLEINKSEEEEKQYLSMQQLEINKSEEESMKILNSQKYDSQNQGNQTTNLYNYNNSLNEKQLINIMTKIKKLSIQRKLRKRQRNKSLKFKKLQTFALWKRINQLSSIQDLLIFKSDDLKAQMNRLTQTLEYEKIDHKHNYNQCNEEILQCPLKHFDWSKKRK